MFLKEIAECKNRCLLFKNKGKELSNSELPLIIELLKSFFKNEPAYLSLASDVQIKIIKKFFQEINKNKNFLYQKESRLEKLSRKLFFSFIKDLEFSGYIQKSGNGFIINNIEYQNNFYSAYSLDF